MGRFVTVIRVVLVIVALRILDPQCSYLFQFVSAVLIGIAAGLSYTETKTH